MTEDPRISEIRAVLLDFGQLGEPGRLNQTTALEALEKIDAILDREPAPADEPLSAPRVLGPEHEYALSVARSAVLKAAGKFVTAADRYRKRDLLLSVQQMADSERACVRVASFLADEIASVRAERPEVQP